MSFNKKGFTLIEILIVIGIIAILAAIVIIAVNPARQFSQAKNAQRFSDTNTILNAVGQFMVASQGSPPVSIPVSSDCPGAVTNEICKTGIATTTCASSNLVNLNELTDSERYITSVPVDPEGFTTNGAGYHIAKSADGRVTVCAPDAELGVTISVTR